LIYRDEVCVHEYGDGLRLGISLSQMAYSFGGEVLTGKLQLFSTELDIKVTSGATRRGLLVEGRKCESSQPWENYTIGFKERNKEGKSQHSHKSWARHQRPPENLPQVVN